MVVRGWFRDSWIDATPELRKEIFAAWIDIHKSWIAKGCRLIFTMDDTGAVGRTSESRCNFYTVWEIPDAALVRELLALVWDEKADTPLRLAKYFALETVIGKPIATMERELDGTHAATPVAP
jgi:hypothetical protein